MILVVGAAPAGEPEVCPDAGDGLDPLLPRRSGDHLWFQAFKLLCIWFNRSCTSWSLLSMLSVRASGILGKHQDFKGRGYQSTSQQISNNLVDLLTQFERKRSQASPILSALQSNTEPEAKAWLLQSFPELFASALLLEQSPTSPAKNEAN